MRRMKDWQFLTIAVVQTLISTRIWLGRLLSSCCRKNSFNFNFFMV